MDATTGPERPHHPQAARSRTNRAALIAAALAVLGACTFLGIAGATYVGLRAYERGSVRRQVARADEHFTGVPARLAAVEQTLAAADIAAPSAARRTLDGASAQLDGIAKDVALAGEDAKDISQPGVARTYTGGVTEAAAGAEAARAAIAYAERLTSVEERAQEGLDKANAGTDLITAAIGDGNREDYRSQESKARRASTLLAEAEQLFNEAAKIDGAAGMGEAAAWASRTRVEADLIRRQAVAASTGDIVAYNRLVNEVNTLTEEVNRMPHPPALTDEHWADAGLKRHLADVRKHADEAARDTATAHRLAEGE